MKILEDIDLDGRYCLLTGATSGIGGATAAALVKCGARLTIICRSEEKGRLLVEKLSRVAKYPVTFIVANLSNLGDVRKAAVEYLESGKPLHLLINNAGVINTERKLSDDGFEETFAVNHLAHFLLTNLLLDRVKESAPARIINVSSNAYTFVKDMGFDDLQAEREYKTFKVYGRSKLANILFTRSLGEKLQGTGVTANCLHPGAVSTGLGTQNGFWGSLLPMLLKPFFRTPEKGAETTLYLALSPALEEVTGQFYRDCKPTKLKPWALDEQQAELLWQRSVELTRL